MLDSADKRKAAGLLNLGLMIGHAEIPRSSTISDLPSFRRPNAVGT